MPDHISDGSYFRELRNNIWVKILKFFDADPDPRYLFDPGSVIRDKHLGSAAEDTEFCTKKTIDEPRLTELSIVQVRVLLREDAGGQGEHCRVHALRLHQDPLHCPHCQGPGRRAQQVIGLYIFVVSSFFKY